MNYVLKGIKSDKFKISESRRNGLPNTLVYSGNFAFNGITSSLLSLMNVIDNDKENFYFTFREKTLKREPLRLKRAPHFADFFPLCGEFKYSIKEFLSRILFYKFNISNRFIVRSLDKAFSREFVRLYGNVKFDRVIHFTGYEKFITGFLERIDAKRAIFVHNDMVSEIREKGNQHKKTLIEAYARYDKVVPVSESARDSVLALATDAKDRITMLYNAYDYKRVLRLAEDDIHYDPSTAANVSEKVLKIILDRDATKFINIGRYSPEKGHDRLINAFERYYNDDPNSYLIIIGGYGPLYNSLRQKVRHLNCRYNVLFIRGISNPYAILKKCDLFILSSFYEALGLVLLEADTLKIPGISTDIGGTREFLQAHKGNLVENTEEGIYQGMLDFKAGKFSLLDFDPDRYNLGVKNSYYKIFD